MDPSARSLRGNTQAQPDGAVRAAQALDKARVPSSTSISPLKIQGLVSETLLMTLRKKCGHP